MRLPAWFLPLFVTSPFGLGCGDDDGVDAGAPDATSDVGLDVAGDATGDTPPDVVTDAEVRDVGAGAGPRPLGPRRVEPTPLSEGTLFASPEGSGDECSEASPCDVWTVAERAAAGDVVFLRGGTYVIERNLSFRGRGTEPAPVVFESYPGETAVLEGSADAADEYYLRVLGDPVVLRLFEVRRMPRAGISVRTSDNVLEGLRVYENLLSGIHVHESYEVPSSNNNLIADCIVHDNSGAGLDSPEFADGGNSDGISMSSGIGNRIENCLVYGNSDDGIDTWRTTESYVGYSIVHGSGLASGNGQGIKAGGAPPSATSFVEHCLSYDNRAAGFDFNSGDEVVFRHNTAWNNDGSGYYAGDNTRVENNLAGDNGSPFGGPASPENNSWQRDGEAMFISTDPASADFLRPLEGGGFEDLGAYAGRE